MAYLHELPAKWRRDAQSAVPEVAGALRACASELEEYHHNDNHDAEWVEGDGCPFCNAERGQ